MISCSERGKAKQKVEAGRFWRKEKTVH